MRIMITALVFFAVAGASAGIVSREIRYSADSTALRGYLVYDDSIHEKRPGIIVVPEWWGLTDYPQKRARMLAELGYVAFAADMYGDGETASNPDEARKYAGEVMGNPATMQARFMAAMNMLKQDEHVDASQIGAIGYCFGGGVVLNMARAGADLRTVVSFHGTLSTQHPATRGTVKPRVLVCNGADDKFNSPEDISKFKSEMDSADVPYKFVNYPGALHAFTNPDATELGKKFKMPIAYNAAADKKSWTEMQEWFRKSFRKHEE